MEEGSKITDEGFQLWVPQVPQEESLLQALTSLHQG
jgi:hypothetical protein